MKRSHSILSKLTLAAAAVSASFIAPGALADTADAARIDTNEPALLQSMNPSSELMPLIEEQFELDTLREVLVGNLARCTVNAQGGSYSALATADAADAMPAEELASENTLVFFGTPAVDAALENVSVSEIIKLADIRIELPADTQALAQDFFGETAAILKQAESELGSSNRNYYAAHNIAVSGVSHGLSDSELFGPVIRNAFVYRYQNTSDVNVLDKDTVADEIVTGGSLADSDTTPSNAATTPSYRPALRTMSLYSVSAASTTSDDTAVVTSADTTETSFSEPVIAWGVAPTSVYKWIGAAGDNAIRTAGNWIQSESWSSDSGFVWSDNSVAPTRANNKGYLLYFEGNDQNITLSGETGTDTSDGGGIMVTGTGNVVTASLGRWAGSIQVDAGNVLNTWWTEQLKDGNIVANGVVNITSGNLNLDTNGATHDRSWYVGVDGAINFSTANTLSGANVVVSGTILAQQEVLNRTKETVKSKDLVVFNAGLNSGLDSFLSVGKIYGVDGNELTPVNSESEITSHNHYYVEKSSAGVKVYYAGFAQKTLTWAGGDENNTWSEFGTNWVDENGTKTSFVSDDNVIFNTAGTVNIAVEGAGVEVEGLTVSQGNVVLSGGDVGISGSVAINEEASLSYHNTKDQTVVLDADGASLSKTGVGKLTLNLANGTTGSLNTLTISSGEVVAVNGIVTGSKSIILAKDGRLENSSEFVNGAYDFKHISGNGTYVFNAHAGNYGAYNGGLRVSLSDGFTGDFVLNKEIWLSFASEHSSFGKATIVLSGDALFHSRETVSLSNNIRLDGTAAIWSDAAGATVTLSGTVTGDAGTLNRRGSGAMVFSNEIDVGTFNQESGTTTFSGETTLGTLNAFGGTTNISGANSTIGTLNISGGTTNISGTGVQFTTLTASGGTTNFENTGEINFTNFNIYSTVNVKSGAVLDLTQNKRSEASNGNGVLNIQGGTVKIAETGWGAGKNLGFNYNADRVKLSNGGILELTVDATVERGFTVVDTGTFRFSGTSGQITPASDSPWAIVLDNNAILTFDVTQENGALNVTKVFNSTSGSIVKTGVGALTLASGFTGKSIDVQSGKLTLGGTIALSDTITNAGTVEFAFGATLNLANLAYEVSADDSGNVLHTYRVIENSGGSFSEFNSTNITNVSGYFKSDRGGTEEWTFDGNGNVVVTTTAKELTWAGGASGGVWNKTNTNWDKTPNDSTDANEAFFAGDSVIFDGDAAVSVGEAVSVGNLTVKSGTVSFSYSNNNSTITANRIIVEGGTLDLDAGGGQTSSLRGAITINNGGTVKLTIGDATGWGGVAGTSIREILVNAGGELVINDDANQTFANISLILDGGEITYGNEDKKNGQTFDLFKNGTTITAKGGDDAENIVTSTISTGFNLRQDDSKITVEEYGKLVVSGSIGNGDAGNHNMIKLGAGTLELTRANTYTGSTTINAGTLKITNKDALGSGTITIGNGANSSAVLDLAVTTSNSTAMDGTTYKFVLNGGTLRTTTPTGNTYAQIASGEDTILLNADSIIDIQANYGMISSGYGNNVLNLNGHKLTKTGDATFWMTNTTVKSGSFDITAGIVEYKAEHDRTISASVSLKNNGVFNVTKTGDGTLSFDGANAEITTVNVNSGTLNLLGETTTITNQLYSQTGAIVIGSEGKNALVTVNRIELGDANNNGTSSLTINAGSTLKVTGSNSDDEYKDVSIILGEWNNTTNTSIAGTLLAQNAEVRFGDSGGDVAISGTLAAKGIGRAKSGRYGQGTFELTLNDDGTLILGESGLVNGKQSGAVTLNAGTIAAYVDMTLARNMVLSSATGTTFDTQKYAFADDGNSISRVTDDTTGYTITVSSVLSDDENVNGSLVKNGAGTLVFSGINTYTGTTTVSAGTLKVSGAGTLGGVNNAGVYGTVTIATSATLDLAGTATLGNAITNNGTITSSGTNTLSGAVSGSGKLVVKGGTLALFGEGPNFYTGGTEINGGTLKVQATGWSNGVATDKWNRGDIGGHIYQNLLKISNGGVLEVVKAQDAKNEATYGTGGAFRGFSVTAGTGTYRYSGEGESLIATAASDANTHIGLANDATLVFDVVEEDATLNVSKQIASNADQAAATDALAETDGVLKKIGAGTLVLSGANLYTGGTRIEEGTIELSGSGTLGTGELTIAGGSGHLTIGENVTISNAVTILVGESNIESAIISGSGTLSLGSGKITIQKVENQQALSLAASVYQYQIVDANSTMDNSWTRDSFTLDKDSWGEGWFVQNYENGLLTLAIPEPTTFGFLSGLAALVFVGGRRRKRKTC